MTTSSLAHRTFEGGSLYSHVVDTLGQQIISGTRASGETISPDHVQAEFEVSRSVVRESLRTLASLGLVQARQQVGTKVLAKEHWHLLNPQIIRWRGRGPDYLEQQRELLELRLGIEPVAAELAAERNPETCSYRLLEEANIMREAVLQNDHHTFFKADARFHRELLLGTNNLAIAQHAPAIEAVLDARASDNRPGMRMMFLHSVERHNDLGNAIAKGEKELSRNTAEQIVRLTLLEFTG